MNGARREELRRLMTEALKTCTRLRDYTNENYVVFTRDDDEMLLEVLDRREKLIDILAAIENAIDDILGEAAEADRDGAMPPEVEEIRRSVRAALDDIAAKDMEIMTLVGGKMQKYKVETLTARSRQSFSAYMRSVSYGQESGDSFDLSK